MADVEAKADFDAFGEEHGEILGGHDAEHSNDGVQLLLRDGGGLNDLQGLRGH